MLSVCCQLPLLGARSFFQGSGHYDEDYLLCSGCLRPCDRVIKEGSQGETKDGEL